MSCLILLYLVLSRRGLQVCHQVVLSDCVHPRDGLPPSASSPVWVVFLWTCRFDISFSWLLCSALLFSWSVVCCLCFRFRFRFRFRKRKRCWDLFSGCLSVSLSLCLSDLGCSWTIYLIFRVWFQVHGRCYMSSVRALAVFCCYWHFTVPNAFCHFLCFVITLRGCERLVFLFFCVCICMPLGGGRVGRLYGGDKGPGGGSGPRHLRGRRESFSCWFQITDDRGKSLFMSCHVVLCCVDLTWLD